MAVGEQDQGLDEFSQGPAVLARLQQGLRNTEGQTCSVSALSQPSPGVSLGTRLHLLHLDVFLGNQPRPMRQQLVDLTEFPQLLRGPMEAQQPLRVTTSLQKLSHVGSHQVRTLVAGSSLWRGMSEPESLSSFYASFRVRPLGGSCILGLTVARRQKS